MAASVARGRERTALQPRHGLFVAEAALGRDVCAFVNVWHGNVEPRSRQRVTAAFNPPTAEAEDIIDDHNRLGCHALRWTEREVGQEGGTARAQTQRERERERERKRGRARKKERGGGGGGPPPRGGHGV